MSSSPTLTCRAVRTWIGVFHDGAADGAAGYCARHVAGCPACQVYLRAGLALECSLGEAARQQSVPLPTGLEQRILNSLERSRVPQPARRRQWAGMGPLLGAAAGLALALFTTNKVVTPKIDFPPPPSPHRAPRENGHCLATGPQWNGLEPSTKALLNAEPLQSEADAVKADARAAMSFLAANFLPGEPR